MILEYERCQPLISRNGWQWAASACYYKGNIREKAGGTRTSFDKSCLGRVMLLQNSLHTYCHYHYN